MLNSLRAHRKVTHTLNSVNIVESHTDFTVFTVKSGHFVGLICPVCWKAF